MNQKLRTVSDCLWDVPGETTIKTCEKTGEGRVQLELAREDLKDQMNETGTEVHLHQEIKERKHQDQARELQEESREKADTYRNELRKRYEELCRDLVPHTHFGTGRLLKVFPDMKHRDYESLVNDLKKYQRKQEHSENDSV